MAWRAHAGDGKYAFSLTTFDPQGKLGQVERATQAAAQGPPLWGLVLEESDEVVFCCPQVLPPGAVDDGTPRFARVSSEIMVAHTGLSADGRLLLTAAQRMALQHEYTFDENMSIASFLEELSLLLQEYTMKPGVRPFGATLLVAYVPTAERQLTEGHRHAVLYRVDPSGSVLLLGKSAAVNGRFDNLESLSSKDELIQKMHAWLGQQPAREAPSSSITILAATLTREGAFDVSHHQIE